MAATSRTRWLHGGWATSRFTPRDRALCGEAMERLAVLQTRAVAFLGVATREQVEELSRELDRLAKRIAKGEPKARRGPRKGGEA